MRPAREGLAGAPGTAPPRPPDKGVQGGVQGEALCHERGPGRRVLPGALSRARPLRGLGATALRQQRQPRRGAYAYSKLS